MKPTARIALAAALSLALLPAAEVQARVECGDEYPTMALGPFPAETTIPLFYASEAWANGSFNARWTGLSCGTHFVVSAEYGDIAGSAAEPSDYSVPEGLRLAVCSHSSDCPNQTTVTFPIVNDGDDGVAELFTIVLSIPQGGSIDTPSAAPFVLVDADGSTRVAFDDLPVSRSETYPMVSFAVWRAGPVSATTAVPYTIGPGPGTPATANDDYAVTSPNPLIFGPGEVVELITLSVVNDKVSEGDETVDISLQAPEAVAPSTKIVTIVDNEEAIPPVSRFHHPKHNWKYRKRDFRIREVHVFTTDEGGSDVVGAQMALRRNRKNGDCQWLTEGGWQQKDCSNRQWLDMTYSDTGDLFFYRARQLKPSVGTTIKNYTAFSRAVDGAGNVEKEFKEKRNANTFEVKRRKK